MSPFSANLPRLGVLALAAAAMSGCMQVSFTRPYTSQAEQSHDYYACKLQSDHIMSAALPNDPLGNADMTNAYQTQALVDCMRAKGYSSKVGFR